MGTVVAIQRPSGHELSCLMESVGWGGASESDWTRSVAAYPCTICAREGGGNLVGYLSAFSDEVMSTSLGELVVHPEHRRQGVATSLIRALEQRYPLAHIYIKALGESKAFYASLGFKIPGEQMTVMFKRRTERNV